MKDPYVYHKTNVLINLAGIHEQKKLDDYETTMVNLAITKLLLNPIEVNSPFDIFKIHEILFSNVYTWAGKKRSINIYKKEPILNGMSVSYTDYSYIDEELKRIEKTINKTNWNNYSHSEIIKQLSRTVSEIWRVHAFREGNTRTISPFLLLFAKNKNINVDVDFIAKNAKYFRNALVMASIDEYNEYQHLEKILNGATIKDIKNDDSDYRYINGYDLKKYRYNYHKQK